MKILPALFTVFLLQTHIASGMVIPLPSSIRQKEGEFIQFPKNICVSATPAAMEELQTAQSANMAPSCLRTSRKLPEITPAYVLSKSKSYPDPINKEEPARLILREYSGDSSTPIHPEGYHLAVSKGKTITIEASSPAGFFYGLQTLTSLLETYKNPDGYKLPVLEINDSPKYRWRGMHLDVSRHFFTVEDVKNFIRTMALFKLNKLHLHLTDGPGWRIQINRYPQLTEHGAWREYDLNREWHWPSTRIGKRNNGMKPYGGFYTQADLKELIDYAARLHIDIVPEIDIPGHFYAALVACPEIACDTFEPLGNGLKGHDYLCMGNPESLKFVTGVIDEITALVPKNTPIHIGGDELIESCGSKCKSCQKLMKEKGLNSSRQLQSWFMGEVISHLRQKEKHTITWDDAYDAGVRNQTVMCWRGEESALAAINNSHPVILCPASHLYFDYYQANPDKEPKAIGGLIPLEKVFSYSPPSSSPLVQGMQGNLWTEYIRTKPELEYMAWPRGIALAERAWGSPRSSFQDFIKRLKPCLRLLEQRGVHYRPLDSNEK